MKIKIKGTEQQMMETLLNFTHSGVDVKICFLFYALERNMNIDSFIYYYNLLEAKEDGE